MKFHPLMLFVYNPYKKKLLKYIGNNINFLLQVKNYLQIILVILLTTHITNISNESYYLYYK